MRVRESELRMEGPAHARRAARRAVPEMRSACHRPHSNAESSREVGWSPKKCRVVAETGWSPKNGRVVAEKLEQGSSRIIRIISMPQAPAYPCHNPLCRTPIHSGRLCEKCLAARSVQLGSSDGSSTRASVKERGYAGRWPAFRQDVIRRIHRLFVNGVGLGVRCGARLPEAPTTSDSRCLARGILTTRGLHLDHIRPLTDAERQNEAAVCDSRRVQLLCTSCHSAKTNRERAEHNLNGGAWALPGG